VHESQPDPRPIHLGGLVQLEVRGCNLSLRHSEAEALMLETRAA
jgi:Fe2+ transport system protein FeoA